MAFIQLYISKSQRGHQHLTDINGNESVRRHIHDFRSAIGTVSYPMDASQLFYLVSHAEDGLIFTVIRTIAGSESDYIAATLFVPSDIDISPKTFADIISAAEASITAEGDIKESAIPQLRTLIGAHYPSTEHATPLPSAGRIYACARYGGPDLPSFADYIAARFYQPRHSDFAAVLLVKDSKDIKIKDASQDLTRHKLEPLFSVQPPKITSDGFAPLISRKPFDKPILAAKGQILVVQWRKPGFEAITQEVHVGTEKLHIVNPDLSEAHKVLVPTSFYVTEEGTDRIIGSCQIKVNGVEIDGPRPFTHSVLEDARVEISAPGYFAYSTQLNLTGSAQILIQMRPLHKTYLFELPMLGAEPIRLYFRTRKRLDHSPIEGYEIINATPVEGAGVTNKLVFTGGNSRNVRIRAIIFGLFGLLIGFLLGWLMFGGKSKPARHAASAAIVQEAAAPEAVTENVLEIENIEEAENPQQIADPDYSAIASYLDNNQNWAFSDLEAAGVAELYQDLNSYNFDRLLTYWKPLLAESHNFGIVAQSVDGAKHKTDPRRGAHNPTFNTTDDKTINWRSYTYWIDP